jgi:hypothetical protein
MDPSFPLPRTQQINDPQRPLMAHHHIITTQRVLRIQYCLPQPQPPPQPLPVPQEIKPSSIELPPAKSKLFSSSHKLSLVSRDLRESRRSI